MHTIITNNFTTNPVLRKAEIAAKLRAQQNRYTGAVSGDWDWEASELNMAGRSSVELSKRSSEMVSSKLIYRKEYGIQIVILSF